MQFELPRIIVNLKNYEFGSSVSGFDLAKILDEVADSEGVEIGLAVNVVDLKDFLRLGLKKTQVWAQHVDVVDYGSFTGSVNPVYLSELGVVGSLLNHSEKRILIGLVKDGVELLEEKNVYSVVCAEDKDECLAIADMWPDAIAFEPPELIGGEVSVTTANPELIGDIVQRMEIPLYVGAGIKTAEDVEESLKLGAYGVLVASGIVKSDNPAKVLKMFLEIIKKYA